MENENKIKLPANAICIENKCEKPAITDYNGHGHFVCQDCYDSLTRYFESEYN